MEQVITTERALLSAIVKNSDFMRKVIPFFKSEYFQDPCERKVFETIVEHTVKYNEPPNFAALSIYIKQDGKVNGQAEQDTQKVIKDIFEIEPPKNEEYLTKTAEDWCKDRAIYNALSKSVDIHSGISKESKNLIPDLLSQALAVCFDTRIGMDFHDDVTERWDYYTNPVHKISFMLDMFNEVTDGGIPRKTLNILVAGVNVGKSMGLISLAADYMRQGLNVLYISNEMSEQEVFKRIDANLLNVSMREIKDLGQNRFKSKVDELRQKSYGKLKVKEYSPGESSVAHYKHLLNELKLKKNFEPDVIMVDYLQITSAAKVSRARVNGFEFFKVVAEELRSLAKEKNCIVWTAAQFNRGGMSDADADMDSIAESKGIADTADGMWSLFRTEQLDELGQIMVKQLKSRYNDKGARLRFTLGVDIYKQKFYNVEQMSEEEINPQKHKGRSTNSLKDRFKNLAKEKKEDKPLNSFGESKGDNFDFDFNF